jgi:TIR domain
MDENKTNVFISYSHEDTIIANAIKDQLTLLAQNGRGGPSLNCFLDTESIPPGSQYEPVIRAALEKADWLIVVFTGFQSVYCGYEIGMYSIIKPHPDKPVDKKPVACLHNVDQKKLPAVVERYNTTLISKIAPYLPDAPNKFTPDAELWWNSPIGRLLREICTTSGLYTPQHRNNNPVQYEIDIAQAASKIALSFEDARKEDELSETPLQAGLEVILSPPFDSKDGTRIPPQSTVLGSSRAFEILGLNVPYSVGGNEAPRIMWDELRQALSTPGRPNIPWLDRLEANIRLAAALKKPRPDDVTFRGSGQDRRIYRAVLTRYKTYRNNNLRFYILLAETFDRRFVGDPDTSLLLTALMLASRWRFTFFERWNETLDQFGGKRSDAEFLDACKQLEYNMEWMENEGVEFGADNLDAMVHAFGEQQKARVERFYGDYHTAKNKLQSKLPQIFEKLSPEKRIEVQGAIIEFLTAVRDQNGEFLELCVHTYAQRVHIDG